MARDILDTVTETTMAIMTARYPGFQPYYSHTGNPPKFLWSEWRTSETPRTAVLVHKDGTLHQFMRAENWGSGGAKYFYVRVPKKTCTRCILASEFVGYIPGTIAEVGP